MRIARFFGALLLSVFVFSFTSCNEDVAVISKMDVDKILPPVLQSAVIKNSDPSSIVLTFDKPMNIDSYRSWAVSAESTAPATSTTLAFNEQKFPGGFGTTVITMYLKDPVAAGKSVKLTYGGMNANTVQGQQQGTAMDIGAMPLLAIPLFYVNNQIGECWDITFDKNGGLNPPQSMAVSKGSKVTLPGRSGMTHSDVQKAFEGWSTVKDQEIITGWREYQPTGSGPLYAKWGQMTVIVGSVHEYFNTQYRYKMGDPNKNTGIAWDISVLVSLLERAQEGYDKEVDMVIPGGVKKVLVPEYDMALIADWAKTLGDLITALTNPPAVIYIKEMRFIYKVPTSGTPTPVYDVVIGDTGKYLIELKGGAGGHVWTKTSSTMTGGKSGYVSGVFNITENTELQLRIGGQGYGSSTYDAANFKYAQTNYGSGGITAYGVGSTFGSFGPMTTWDSKHAGGYNGGGNGGAAGVKDFRGGSGGGGATDIMIKTSSLTRTLTGVPGTDPRFMVAGGGGGAVQQEGNWSALAGGDAGGINGTNGAGSKSSPPRGGTQTAYPANSTPAATVDGVAGFGATAVDGNSNSTYLFEGRGGGGGGWWGGGAMNAVNNSANYSVYTGAGGSSYVMASGESKDGKVTKTAEPSTNETNPKQEYSNGWARILWMPPTN